MHSFHSSQHNPQLDNLYINLLLFNFIFLPLFLFYSFFFLQKHALLGVFSYLPLIYIDKSMQRSNGLPACASCRHQRKKCTEKCLLARFFPAEKTREFQAVHKVFGVSNVTKILKDLNMEDGKRAVDSLVWEAICRTKDPVLGPYGEYRRVYEELKLYKNQYQQHILRHQLQGGGGVGLMGWNVTNGHVYSNNSEVVIEDSRPYTVFSSMQNMESFEARKWFCECCSAAFCEWFQ